MGNGEGDSEAGSGYRGPTVGMCTDSTEKPVVRVEPKSAKDGGQDSSHIDLTPEVRFG